MDRRKLGLSELVVSRFALGTMTFGEQNDGVSAFKLLDQAVDGGINFIDTAEMYPSPARAETYGESERIIGRWLKRRGRSDDLVVATKAAGPAGYVKWIRGGQSSHVKAHLEEAVEHSLRRLQLDRIDLFQLHWPDRATNFFGQLGFKAPADEAAFSVEASLEALDALIATGKIRAVGLCNETPWGVMQFMHIARQRGMQQIISVQNPYNLLNRSAEVGLAEVAWRESVDFIAYSPLAFGVLTGKYHGESISDDARLSRYPHYKRYLSDNARLAASRYLEIARDAGLEPAAMALAFVASKPWVASVIIGATRESQLADNLAAYQQALPRNLLKAIDAVHQEISNPCP